MSYNNNKLTVVSVEVGLVLADAALAYTRDSCQENYHRRPRQSMKIFQCGRVAAAHRWSQEGCDSPGGEYNYESDDERYFGVAAYLD